MLFADSSYPLNDRLGPKPRTADCRFAPNFPRFTYQSVWKTLLVGMSESPRFPCHFGCKRCRRKSLEKEGYQNVECHLPLELEDLVVTSMNISFLLSGPLSPIYYPVITSNASKGKHR
ncbi:hypothetical protein B9Z55_026049 [Caenorhabditis nigoni]|uniref:Uncharacterized protein n=1 Tax=Caenorhabditis nigoni TaxID=1611254 RepID=A0A2G5T1J5_9PELO|nr:hypothetical protein B9Z55_026049 [Caenorhabditis nigoni]